MNVQIKVNGLGRVDFVSATGWIRDPQVELCGIDDADLCLDNTAKFLSSIEPVPFENIRDYEQYVDGAVSDLKVAIQSYVQIKGEVNLVGTIQVHIRPVPKSSGDA